MGPLSYLKMARSMLPFINEVVLDKDTSRRDKLIKSMALLVLTTLGVLVVNVATYTVTDWFREPVPVDAPRHDDGGVPEDGRDDQQMVVFLQRRVEDQIREIYDLEEDLKDALSLADEYERRNRELAEQVERLKRRIQRRQQGDSDVVEDDTDILDRINELRGE